MVAEMLMLRFGEIRLGALRIMEYMMKNSGLSTTGINNFNKIKTDAMGCITAGQGFTCPLNW